MLKDEPIVNEMGRQGIVVAGWLEELLDEHVNQYTQVILDNVAPEYPQWDANGNLSQYDGKTLTYDAENRLISVTGAGLSAQFTYDYRNRVTSRTFNGDTTYLVYDEWNLIAEYDETGQQVAKYIHGPRIDEVILTINASGSFFHHHDALGSTTHLTDSSGNIIEYYTYDPYGAATILNASGTVISQSAYGNRFLFTGRKYLEEIGLYDYRNRVYSMELGRFVQTDPIRFDAGDVNIYRYVFNNPLRWIDPLGLGAFTPNMGFNPSFGSTMNFGTGTSVAGTGVGYSPAVVAPFANAGAAVANSIPVERWDGIGFGLFGAVGGGLGAMGGSVGGPWGTFGGGVVGTGAGLYTWAVWDPFDRNGDGE